MTRRQLLRSVDSRELTDWLAFEQEYGLADGYFVAGLLAPPLHAALGRKKCSAADFVPYFAKAKRRQTTAEMRDRFKAASSAVNRQGRV